MLNVVTSEPGTVVRERSYIVAEPPAVIVPRRERVVVMPRRAVIIEQPAYVAPAPRDSFAYRGTVRSGGIVTTGYSSEGSCVIDINGFERCY